MVTEDPSTSEVTLNDVSKIDYNQTTAKHNKDQTDRLYNGNPYTGIRKDIFSETGPLNRQSPKLWSTQIEFQHSYSPITANMAEQKYTKTSKMEDTIGKWL